MRFDILTLFPEFFEKFLQVSILGRAIEKNKIEINLFDIRKFSKDKHKKVDDEPYGGGAGMVMTCQPLFDNIEYVKNLKKDQSPVIFFTPHGKKFNQELAEKFIDFEKNKDQKKIDKRFILLCGHYEGIDQRVRDKLVDLEISIGNFVLSGGELAAQIFIDVISRLVPGVLGKKESHEKDSFSACFDRKIEYPHYTRPAVFENMKVPEILLSGNHGEIEKWRMNNLKN